MAWEFKMLEPLDYGHPGAGPRFIELEGELKKLSEEGWEVVSMTPSMQRGRTVESGREDKVTMTTVAMCLLLRRKVE